jgi:hypothetical protein
MESIAQTLGMRYARAQLIGVLMMPRLSFFLIPALMLAGPVLAAKKSAKIAQPIVEAPAAKSATIMAYKRDPIAIFDAAGSKLRDVPKASLPKANSAAAQVVNSKAGFVAIMIDGKPAWLRLSAVDYVGNLPSPPCAKVAVQLAMMEEDGVERSLGLGCSKTK